MATVPSSQVALELGGGVWGTPPWFQDRGDPGAALGGARLLGMGIVSALALPVLQPTPMLESSGRISHGFFLCPFAGALGSREEPEFVTARAGESVILGCDVIHPLTGQPPPYVVEWFKFGVPIPIFIKFGFYPPHVDPEYAGESGGTRGTCRVPAAAQPGMHGSAPSAPPSETARALPLVARFPPS